MGHFNATANQIIQQVAVGGPTHGGKLQVYGLLP